MRKFALILAILLISLSRASARRLDTNEYGIIHVGMSEAEVVMRFGPPDQVVIEKTNGIIWKALHYMPDPIQDQKITTIIHFKGSRISSKERVYVTK
jgi:hypothetical protein